MRNGKMIQFSLLSALLLAMSFPAVSPAALDAVSGLPDPAVDAVAAGGDPAQVATSLANGFPLWYQDSSGRKLELCLEQRVEKTAASGGGLFFPCLTAEPVTANPISFPTNFGAEAFYWTAAAITTFTSSQDGLPAGGGDALLVVGEEASFLNGIPNDGEQIVFGRTRLRINVPIAGTYRVTYPFGTRDFVVPAVSAGRDINQTLDIGILAARDFLASLSDGPFRRRRRRPPTRLPMRKSSISTGAASARFSRETRPPASSIPLAINICPIRGRN